MPFVPYNHSRGIPNVIVDGTSNESTVLTLSHWRQSGTPEELLADTSAEIVFKYLDSPKYHVETDVVSNNHYDEDGLVGMFAFMNASLAQRHRDLLIDVAEAGDFGIYKSLDAARIVFTLSAFADPEISLPGAIFKLGYPEMAAELCRELLIDCRIFWRTWRDTGPCGRTKRACCWSPRLSSIPAK